MQHSRSTNGTHYSVQTVLWMKSLSMEKKVTVSPYCMFICNYASNLILVLTTEVPSQLENKINIASLMDYLY